MSHVCLESRKVTSFYEGCDCKGFLAQVSYLLTMERRCKNELSCEKGCGLMTDSIFDVI